LDIVTGYESIKSTFIKRIIGFSLSKLMRK
jgi:hypothetical protein